MKAAPFAGQKSAWQALKDGEHSRKFNFFTADASGCVKPAEGSPGGAAWNYVDASNLVFYNAYGTGAGAHSDIYRQPMGKMLWGLIGDSK